MTLEELYTMIGGNYEHAKQIMRMDKMIDRYVRKLKNSPVKDKLTAAAETLDPGLLFESAHAMKGVCANLGLDDLANGAEEITEEFRPENTRKLTDEEVREKLTVLLDQFQKTLDGIAKYEAEN